MRYAQGGGLTPLGQAVRERLRLDAAERFGRGDKNAVIANDLRVSVRSVERWRRSWNEGGTTSLRSRGGFPSPARCGPLCWRRNCKRRGGPWLAGPTVDPGQSPGRDRAAVPPHFVGARGVGPAAAQRLVVPGAGPPGNGARRGGGHRTGEGDLAARGSTAAALEAWIVYEDEAGISMTPHRARTWGRRGRTPVIRVRGTSRGRVSVAAMTCYKSGERPRLIFRYRVHGHRPGRSKAFTRSDYRDLAARAHIQLGGPLALIWDNLNVHRAAGPASTRPATTGSPLSNCPVTHQI